MPSSELEPVEAPPVPAAPSGPLGTLVASLRGRWLKLSSGSVNRKVFGAAMVVGALTLLIKVVSVVKESVVAAAFGTGSTRATFARTAWRWRKVAQPVRIEASSFDRLVHCRSAVDSGLTECFVNGLSLVGRERVGVVLREDGHDLRLLCRREGFGLPESAFLAGRTCVRQLHLLLCHCR